MPIRQKGEFEVNSSLSQTLHERSQAIARRWHDAVAPFCPPILDAADLQGLVLELSEQLIDCLTGEPFELQRARAVGVSLANLRLSHADALEQSLNIIQQGLTSGLSEQQLAALQPRLAEAIAALVAGFFCRAQTLLFQEQELLRQAISNTLQQTERRLREMEARYRTISQLTSDYAFAVRINPDNSFKLEWATDAYWRLTGLERGEALGERWFEVVHPANREAAIQSYADLLAGRPIQFESLFRMMDGEERWLMFHAHPQWDADEGRVVRIIGAAQDITRQKEVEIALRASETRLRTIYSAIPDLVYLTDAETNILDANPALLQIHGLSLDQIRQRNALDFFVGGDLAQIEEAAARLRSGIPVRGLEVKGCNAAGEPCWYEVHAIPIIEDSVVTSVVNVARDITRRVQAEEALRASEERYRIVSELASDFAYTVRLEPDGELVREWVTDAFQRITEMRLEEAEARGGWSILVHPDDLPRTRQLLQRQLETGEPGSFEVRIITGRGRVRWLHNQSRPLFDEQGRVVGLIGAERKQAEQQLLQTERLTAMGRLAATMAHEINNPLQAIRTNLELVLDFPLEEEERQQRLQAVRHEVHRLIAIAERMLSFARPPRYYPNQVSVTEVVRETAALLEQILRRNQIELALDLDELPPIRASREQLGQVILNLMLNAIEAMPEGGWLGIATRRGDQHLTITVKDSGPGIPADDLERIFDPFFTTKEQGTGLGLSVSQLIVQQHGGTITAENAPGGAVLTVVLPIGEEKS